MIKNNKGFSHVDLLIILVVLAAISLVGIHTYHHVFPTVQASSGNASIIDISSPQCNGSKVISGIGKHSFGIVGLNGTGLDFALNPCLKSEVALFYAYDLYVGTNYPSADCPSSLSAYKCGVKAADFDLWIISASLHPSGLWIDVESGSGIPWSSQANNRAFLNGLYNTLSSNYVVGYYSNYYGWNSITGNMKINSSIWYAGYTYNQAKTNCTTAFGGDKYVGFSQYYSDGLDHDLNC
jgi:hypothetical protein